MPHSHIHRSDHTDMEVYTTNAWLPYNTHSHIDISKINPRINALRTLRHSVPLCTFRLSLLSMTKLCKSRI